MANISILDSYRLLVQQHVSPNLTQTDFKLKTNMPPIIRLQQDARVMYLDNSLISDSICNETNGIITDLDKQQPSVQIAFCVQGVIIHKWIIRQHTFIQMDNMLQEHNFHYKTHFL
ncbi:hypothetical protein RclHR1_02310010 [Rhizophagus clarus]|uniref:Uncharacterized protein n=1 Tax=Rhizophagus clarus TaxID=94130 RepID=A0A2Z6R8R1_9GLOM|nr:hypothetical protein RclHR1_02310010 [Rhizophagus clarus]GES73350.1 hypothetical protein RCL_jg3860.t1 [Rhizophagus clarus]